MQLSKKSVVELVRSIGRQDDAARAETELPDPVDLERDAAVLESVGLDASTLSGHLAPDGPRGPSADVGPAGGASTGRFTGQPTTGTQEYGAPPTAGSGGGDTGTSDASSGEPGLPGGAIGGEPGADGEGPTLTGGADAGAGYGTSSRD